MKLHSIMTGLVAVGTSTALAQDLQLAEAYVPRLGNTIVVTAARAPQELKDTLASTTVIEREQIERSQARNLYQLLKATPGLQVRRDGGRGNVTTMGIRGMSAGGTLVLVDGVKVESATAGNTNLEYFSLEQVERIEIVRGPSSSLYGSSALGGVVQIFTRRQAEDGVRYSAGYGNDNTREGVIQAAGSHASSRYNITVSHVESDGFDVQYVDDNATGIAAYDRDDDPYRNSAIAFRAETSVHDNADLFVSLLRNDNKADWDGGGKPYTESDSTLALIGGNFSLGSLDSKLQYSRFQQDYYSDDAIDAFSLFTYGEGSTQRDQTSWENSYRFQQGIQLNFGVDYAVDSSGYDTNFGLYETRDRDLFSGYVNAQAEVGVVQFQGGVRHDRDDQFGSELTGDGGIALWLSDTLKLSATYGEAFKAPASNDLYYPGYGNPNLEPEKSRSVEVGLDSYTDLAVISFHIYETQADNLIRYNPIIFGPENVAQVKVQGAELRVGAELAGVHTGLGLAYQKSRDEDGTTDRELAFSPRQIATLDLDKEWQRYAAGITLYAQGRQHDTQGNAMAGYADLALRLSYDLNDEIRFRVRVDNLLDKDYVNSPGYNTEGFFAMFFVDYTPR